MASMALREWQGASSEALDEIELVHRAVEGAGAGRHVLTQHSEVAQALVVAVPDPALGSVLEELLTDRRYLDRGNPTPARAADQARTALRTAKRHDPRRPSTKA